MEKSLSNGTYYSAVFLPLQVKIWTGAFHESCSSLNDQGKGSGRKHNYNSSGIHPLSILLIPEIAVYLARCFRHQFFCVPL